MCFYSGKPGHFQKNCQHFWKEKGGTNNVVSKKGSDQRRKLEIATSEEELMLITEESELHLAATKQRGWSTLERRSI